MPVVLQNSRLSFAMKALLILALALALALVLALALAVRATVVEDT
jgi:hypothetical protein